MLHVDHSSSLSRRANRRRFLQSLCSLAGFGVVSLGGAVRGSSGQESATRETRDVPWLAEVQRRPASVPRDKLGELSPLLISADGKPIEALEAWTIQRRELRNTWMKFLGPMPLDRPAVRLEVLREDHPPGCVRQLVQYEGEPGQTVQGYLLRPSAETKGKRAGVVGLHQTTKDSIDEIAGVSGPEPMQIGLKLAQRGFVVFCPRCFLWQDAANYTEAVDRFRRQHPRTLGMHKMLYDATRGVDVLASLPDVDARRIGAIGHSLGAKETLYLAAFDERVQVGVASEGGVGFKFTNWDAPWYLGSGINEPDFKLNHHQLLALIAPRPFLILAGENSSPAASDGDRTWPFVEAALPVYQLYGEPARIGLLNHRLGHSLPSNAFARATEWLETYSAM